MAKQTTNKVNTTGYQWDVQSSTTVRSLAEDYGKGAVEQELPEAMSTLIRLSEELDGIKAILEDTKVRGEVTNLGVRNTVKEMLMTLDLIDYVQDGKVAKIVTTAEKTSTKIKDVHAGISHLSATAQKKLRAEGIIYEDTSPERVALRLNDAKE